MLKHTFKTIIRYLKITKDHIVIHVDDSIFIMDKSFNVV